LRSGVERRSNVSSPEETGEAVSNPSRVTTRREVRKTTNRSRGHVSLPSETAEAGAGKFACDGKQIIVAHIDLARSAPSILLTAVTISINLYISLIALSD